MGRLTGSVAHGRVEGCADYGDIISLVRVGETFQRLEVSEAGVASERELRSLLVCVLYQVYGWTYLLIPFSEQLGAEMLGDDFAVVVVGVGEGGAGEGQQREELHGANGGGVERRRKEGREREREEEVEKRERERV